MNRRPHFDWLGLVAVVVAVGLFIAVAASVVNKNVTGNEDLAKQRAAQSLCIASVSNQFLIAVGNLLVAYVDNDDTGIQLAKEQIVTATGELNPEQLADRCRLGL